MQSEQRRQRRQELKRLEREEKRRVLAETMPIFDRVELRRIVAAGRQAQMCASTDPTVTAAIDPQMCARDHADAILPPDQEGIVREAVRIARRRASLSKCVELMALTYLASGPRVPG